MWVAMVLAVATLAHAAPEDPRNAEADALEVQARELIDATRYPEAEALVREILALRQAAIEPDPLAVASSLAGLARLLKIQGKFEGAMPLYEEALAIRREQLGPDHPDVGDCLNNMASLLKAQGDYPASRELYEQSLAIYREALGPDDPKVATGLNNLAVLMFTLGDYEGTRPLLEESLARRRETLGSNHPEVAEGLNNLAFVLQTLGDYRAARPLYEESLDIYRATLGPHHPQVAGAMSNLAALLGTMGDYEGAQPLVEETLAIWRATLGPEHPNVALGLNNIAYLLEKRGDYAAARLLFEESLALRRKVLGSDHPDVAASLTSLGWLLKTQGDYKAALPLVEESLDIKRAALGPDHPEIAQNLNNLALLLADSGDLEQARSLHEQSLELARTALGPEHPLVAQIMANLATTLKEQGDFEAAQPLLEESLQLAEEALGPDHPGLVQMLGNLGTLYAAQGNLEATLPLYERALALERKTLGPDHPDVARTLNGLATVLKDLGKREAANPLWDESLAIVESRLELLDALSEREALLYLRDQRPTLDSWLTAHADPEAGWTHALRFKGSIGAGFRAARALTAIDSDTAEAAANLTEVRRELARLAHADGKGGADRADRLEALTAESERLQRELLTRSARYRADRDAAAATPAELCAALPDGTALVDLLRYRREAKFHYVAFSTVGGTCAPVRTELGPARPLDKAVADWRAVLSDPEAIADRVDTRGERVTELLWAPLESAVAGATELLVVPDGPLSAAPFGALPVGDGRYLIEDLPVTYLDRANDLLLQPQGEPEGAVVVGGIDYDGIQSTLVASVRGALAACNEGGFASLPGTEVEAEAFADRWQRTRQTDVLVLQRAAATETAVAAAMQGKAVAHLATHGFFSTGRCKSALEGDGYDPMLLSGLVFAGANLPSDPLAPEDGVLTAAEVATLDLSSTGLVVLSACQTGLGEVRSGEGVLGLRRAFAIAGAHSLVMSLWSVSDAATAELMDEMYRHYLRRRKPLSASAALREAKLEALAAQRRRGDVRPQEWAAFIATDAGSRF